MEYSVDEHFGLVPSLSLCDRAEHPVRFAWLGLVAIVGGFPVASFAA